MLLLYFAIGIALLLLGTVYWVYKRLPNYVLRYMAKGKIQQGYRLGRWLLWLFTLPIYPRFLRPKIGDLLLELDLLAAKLNDTEASFRYVSRAANPEHGADVYAMALPRLVYLLKQAGRHEEAAQKEEEITQLSPQESADDSTTLIGTVTQAEITRTSLLLEQGRFHEVLAVAQEFVEQDPAASHLDQSPNYNVITALRYLGRYDDAIAGYDALDERYRRQADQLCKKFKSKKAQSNWRQDCEMSLAQDLLHLIPLCLEAGRLGSATEHWERLRGKPMYEFYTPIYTGIGAWFYAATGDVDRAREMINAVDLSRLPHNILYEYARYGVSQAYINLRDYDAAINLLSEMIEHTNDAVRRAEYRTLLANCYRKRERTDLAQSTYEQVIAAGFEEAAFTQHARRQREMPREHPEQLRAGHSAR